jgi:hypothetical protein
MPVYAVLSTWSKNRHVPRRDNDIEAQQLKNVAWVGDLLTGTYSSEWQIDWRRSARFMQLYFENARLW